MIFLKNRFLKLFGISLLLLGVFFLLKNYLQKNDGFSYEKKEQLNFRQLDFGQGKLSSGNISIDISIADTPKNRELGLSFTENLKENQGMLFIFEENSIHGFWMKDMFYPIDIIWLSEDMRVIHIEKNVQPDTYPKVFSPNSFSKYVLEVPSGFSTDKNIKNGQVFSLSKTII